MILFRALLIALPVAVWFIWADLSRRRGKPMGSTPWPWLIGGGVALAALSLIVTGVVETLAPTGDEAPLHSNAGPGKPDAPDR